MIRVSVWNATRRTELANGAKLADGYWSRLRGLLGRPQLRPGEGMVLRPCRSVHSWGLGYPIDVAFVDRRGRITAMYQPLAPRAATAWHLDADVVIELPAGTLGAASTQLGDALEIVATQKHAAFPA